MREKYIAIFMEHGKTRTLKTNDEQDALDFIDSCRANALKNFPHHDWNNEGQVLEVKEIRAKNQ